MEDHKEYNGMYVHIRDVVLREFRRNYSQALIYSIIEGYQKNENGCWITNEQISDRLGLSVRAVQYAITSLEAKGYIRRITKNDIHQGIRVRKMKIAHYIDGQSKPKRNDNKRTVREN